MNTDFEINLICLFCQAPLQAEKGASFESGDLIKCELCGELNDYDSVIEITIGKVKTQVEDEIVKTMNNLFK